MTYDPEALLTTAQAAKRIKVHKYLIRNWARRGLLTPAARNERGWPLYRLADVLDVEKRTRPRVVAPTVDHVSQCGQ